MQFGLPNVTSTVGAEAMHGNFDWNGFITDNRNRICRKSNSTLSRRKYLAKISRKTVI